MQLVTAYSNVYNHKNYMLIAIMINCNCMVCCNHCNVINLLLIVQYSRKNKLRLKDKWPSRQLPVNANKKKKKILLKYKIHRDMQTFFFKIKA